MWISALCATARDATSAYQADISGAKHRKKNKQSTVTVWNETWLANQRNTMKRMAQRSTKSMPCRLETPMYRNTPYNTAMGIFCTRIGYMSESFSCFLFFLFCIILTERNAVRKIDRPITMWIVRTVTRCSLHTQHFNLLRYGESAEIWLNFPNFFSSHYFPWITMAYCQTQKFSAQKLHWLAWLTFRNMFF